MYLYRILTFLQNEQLTRIVDTLSLGHYTLKDSGIMVQIIGYFVLLKSILGV